MFSKLKHSFKNFKYCCLRILCCGEVPEPEPTYKIGDPYDFRVEDCKIPELSAAAQAVARAQATFDASRLPSISVEPMATAGAAMSRDSVTLRGEISDEKY